MMKTTDDDQFINTDSQQFAVLILGRLDQMDGRLTEIESTYRLVSSKLVSINRELEHIDRNYQLLEINLKQHTEEVVARHSTEVLHVISQVVEPLIKRVSKLEAKAA